VKALFFVLFSVLFCNLGFWQVERLKQKEQLLSDFYNHTNGNIYADVASIQRGDLYKTIRISGQYIEKPIFFYTSYESKPVYEVLQPFKTISGQYFLVNRGVIHNKNSFNFKSYHINQKFFLEGYILGFPDKKPYFIKNDLSKNEWFYINNNDLKKFFNIDNFQPFIILPKAESDFLAMKVEINKKVRFRNEHFQYAITWFSLSLVALVIAAFIIIKRNKT